MVKYWRTNSRFFAPTTRVTSLIPAATKASRTRWATGLSTGGPWVDRSNSGRNSLRSPPGAAGARGPPRRGGEGGPAGRRGGGRGGGGGGGGGRGTGERGGSPG